MLVPPGRYTVTGTSPAFNDGNSSCLANDKATVVRDQAVQDDVYCQVP
jgi:hypothetical protein